METWKEIQNRTVSYLPVSKYLPFYFTKLYRLQLQTEYNGIKSNMVFCYFLFLFFVSYLLYKKLYPIFLSHFFWKILVVILKLFGLGTNSQRNLIYYTPKVFSLWPPTTEMKWLWMQAWFSNLNNSIEKFTWPKTYFVYTILRSSAHVKHCSTQKAEPQVLQSWLILQMLPLLISSRELNLRD